MLRPPEQPLQVEKVDVASVDIPAVAMEKKKPPGGLRTPVLTLLLGPEVTLAIQLALGILIVSLFVFVRAISFNLACVSATLLCVVMVMMAPDPSIGTRATAAVSNLGPGILATLLGGMVGTIAKTVGGPSSAAYTAVLCVLSVLVLAMLVVNRVGMMPPFLWALGMISCLVFGLSIITGRAFFPISSYWRDVVAQLVAAQALAAGVALTVTLLVMPSLASDEVQDIAIRVLRGAGAGTSAYAARIFVQADKMPPQCAKALAERRMHSYTNAAGEAMVVAEDDDETIMQDEAAVLAIIADMGMGLRGTPSGLPGGGFSHAGGPRVAPSGAGTSCAKAPPVNTLRPPLARARMALNSARVEAPWLTGGFNPDAWVALIGALEQLVTRISALEGVLMDGYYCNESHWDPELIAAFRWVYAEVAASLALIADAAYAHRRGGASAVASCRLLTSHRWAAAREQLSTGMRAQMEGHWKRQRSGAVPGRTYATGQLRALMFTHQLSVGIITAMEGVETAAAAALCGAPLPPAPPGPPSGAHPPSPLAKRLGWMYGLVAVMLCIPLWDNWAVALGVTLPAAFKGGSKGLAVLVSGRNFQAGLKYWLALASLMVATIVVQASEPPPISTMSLGFGYVACALSMSERVEATVGKVVFWLAGTWLGGALGLLAMAFSPLATNPFGLVAVVCGAAFIVGLLGSTYFRIFITLSLMTLSAMTFCQHKACCGSGTGTGTVEYFLARTLSVTLGVLWGAAVSRGLKPWYTANWALETLGSTFRAAVHVVRGFNEQYNAEGSAAHAASRHRGGAAADVVLAGPSPDDSGPVGTNEVPPVPDGAAASGRPKGAAVLADVLNGPPYGAPLLQPLVAMPLAGVQMSLVKDGVLWRHGLYATPPIVHSVLQAELRLLDELAAQQQMLAPPSVTGAFTGSLYEAFVRPMQPGVDNAMLVLSQLADCTAAHLAKPTTASCEAIREKIDELNHARAGLWRQLAELRRQYHVRIMAAPPQEVDYLVAPDDATRVLGFIQANIKVVNAATQVAHAAMTAPIRGDFGPHGPGSKKLGGEDAISKV